MSAAEAEALVVRDPGTAPGIVPVIGRDAPLGWDHGFSLDRLSLAAGERGGITQDDVEVVFVHRGTVTVGWSGGTIDLGEGDTMTVPPGLPRAISSKDGAVAYVARRVHDASSQGGRA